MTDDKAILWILDNMILFPPTNKKPTQQEAKELFEVADFLDTTQTHRPTSCGRCYYNAKNAIMRAIPPMFEKKSE